MYTAVLEFIDALTELPGETWLAIGRAIREHPDRLSELSSARAILDVTIADRHLALSAWHVKDAIETLAFVAGRDLGNISARDRRFFDETHAAAEEAALAVLARPYLADADFAVLYAPFAHQLPAPAPDTASAA